MSAKYVVSPNSSEWANGEGFEVYQPDDPEAGSRLFKTRELAQAFADALNTPVPEPVEEVRCTVAEFEKLQSDRAALLEGLKVFVAQTKGRFLEHSNENSARLAALAAIAKAEGKS